MMENIEKVLAGLEYCTTNEVCSAKCRYFETFETDGRCGLDRDALELLKIYACEECVEPEKPEPEKPYRGIIVALDTDGDVLAAWRTDSYEETTRIMYEEFMRLMDDFDGDVAIQKHRDGFGEEVTEVTYNGGQDKVTYKLVLEGRGR